MRIFAVRYLVTVWKEEKHFLTVGERENRD